MKSETILRQTVGVDVSKDTLDVAIVKLTTTFEIKIVANKKTKNDKEGYDQILKWSQQYLEKEIPSGFTMEATGVYYEGFAYYLYEHKENVHVLLPNKAKKFAESLDIKSKTDKLDAQMLGRMGVERKIRNWNPHSTIFKTLRCFTRERRALIDERTTVKNQLHAMQYTEKAPKVVLKRYEQRVAYLTRQIVKVEADIEKLIKEDVEISRKVKKTLTAPGIGLITLAVLLAETNGFAAIENCKQISSYAGYDIRIRESGKWKGHSKISKKGNSHIRAAMFFPACVSVKYNKEHANFYNRLKDKKEKAMIANTAVQRKLLGLVYTIWKNDTVFDPCHNGEKNKNVT